MERGIDGEIANTLVEGVIIVESHQRKKYPRRAAGVGQGHKTAT